MSFLSLSMPTICRFKYTYMEEMLGNIPGARQVFERWMEWEPVEQAWFAYIKMELRYKEVDRARAIYERFVMVHPDIKNWIKFAKFEESQGNVGKSSHFSNDVIILSHYSLLPLATKNKKKHLTQLVYNLLFTCTPSPWKLWLRLKVCSVPQNRLMHFCGR